jgi:hypothetical protein
MKTTKRLIFVGAWPKPFGGVAEFTRRIILGFGDHISLAVLRSKSKIDYEERVHAINCRNNFSLFVTLLRLKLKSKDFFHLNFSTPASLLFIATLPGWSKNIITLHNGDLHFSSHKSVLYIQRKILKRAKYVIALNSKQYQDYLNIEPSMDNLYLTTSYLKPTNLNGEVNKVFDVFASGFLERIYNLEMVLEAAKSAPDLSFCIVMYGEVPPKAIDRFAAINNVNVFRDVHPEQFIKLVAASKVFLRPTKVDSVGIALCDAAYLKLKIIATDCCERPPNTLLLNKDSLSADTITSAIRNTLLSPDVPLETEIGFDAHENYLAIYDSLS